MIALVGFCCSRGAGEIGLTTRGVVGTQFVMGGIVILVNDFKCKGINAKGKTTASTLAMLRKIF